MRRTLIILWLAFIWTLAAYGLIMHFVPVPPADTSPLRTALLAVAALTGATVLYLRLARIAPFLSRPLPVTQDEADRLRVLYLLCFALSESVGVYGLVLHLLGARSGDVLPFLVAAVALLALCYPRLPKIQPPAAL